MWSLLFVVALASPLCISAMFNDYEAVYPYYKMVEEAVTNNSKSLYLLRQGFLPAVIEKPWLIDDVHMLIIIADVDYYHSTDNNTSVHFKRNWMLRWTDSSLLSLISPDELLAFDPVVFRFLYNSIAQNTYAKGLELTIQLNDTSSNTTNAMEIEDKLLKAVTLFFSWGKAYARSNGKPTLWDEKDQGYVGMWYSYFAIGSPFTIQNNYQEDFNHIHFVFLLIFIFLNLLVPVALLKDANKWNKKLKKVFHRQHTSFTIIFFWATGATITLFNLAYIIVMIGAHMRGHPTALNCFLNTGNECTVPKTEYENTFTIKALISKAVVFPVATAIELFAAVIAARKLDIPAPPLFAARICRCCKMARYIKYFVFWQMLVFAQIVVGLMGIPLTITLVITTAQTTSQLIALIIALLSLAVLIGYVFSIQWRRSMYMYNWKSVLKSCITFLGAVLIIATLSAAIAQYFWLAKGGLSMKGFKGYVLALLPPILLSLFLWALKRKFKKSSSQNETLEYLQGRESGCEDRPLLASTKGDDPPGTTVN